MAEQFGIAGFVDVETTGLSPHSDEIIELALCLFKFKWATGEIVGIVDEYVGLREPGRGIPRRATAVHGICDCDVEGKCLDMEIVESMIHKAEFLVAHNASFDRGFMIKLFQICQTKHWLCSMRGIRWRERGFSRMALQTLLNEHGIKVSRAHRAEDDVKASIRLLSLRDASGGIYFGELLQRLPSYREKYPVVG